MENNENITVRTGLSRQVDSDVAEHANSIAQDLTKHIAKLSASNADMEVSFDQFQFVGERGYAMIRLGGTLNDERIEAKHEWQIIPTGRGSIGGKLIASAVSNSMHGGTDGIRKVTIENVLSAASATFCGKIDDTLGIETSPVRAGILSLIHI